MWRDRCLGYKDVVPARGQLSHRQDPVEANASVPREDRGRARLAGGVRVVAQLLSTPSVAAVTVAALVVTSLAFAVHGLRNPLGTDYLATLTGGQLLATHQCLYCEATQIRLQSLLLHQPIALPDAFFGPPAQALAVRPLLSLSPQVGFALFDGLSLLSATVAGAIAWRFLGRGGSRRSNRLVLVGLSVASLPAAWNYWLGQWDALLLLAAMAALALLVRGRPRLAGLVLSLLLMKPQTVWLLPLVLIFAGQWRVLSGVAIGALLWLGSSLTLAGTDQLAQWPTIVLARAPLVSTSVGVPGLAAVVGGEHTGLPLAIVCAIGAAALCVLLRRQLRAQPLNALALGFTLSFAAAPHIFSYDLVLLAVPLTVLGLSQMDRAVVCAALLSVGYLGDRYLPIPGPMFETAALLLVGALLVRLLVHNRVSGDGTPRGAKPVFFGPRQQAAAMEAHFS